MKKDHSSSITSDRPYGGTAFVFNKCFTSFLRPFIKFENERLTVMEFEEECPFGRLEIPSVGSADSIGLIC